MVSLPAGESPKLRVASGGMTNGAVVTANAAALKVSTGGPAKARVASGSVQENVEND